MGRLSARRTGNGVPVRLVQPGTRDWVRPGQRPGPRPTRATSADARPRDYPAARCPPNPGSPRAGASGTAGQSTRGGPTAVHRSVAARGPTLV